MGCEEIATPFGLAMTFMGEGLAMTFKGEGPQGRRKKGSLRGAESDAAISVF